MSYEKVSSLGLFAKAVNSDRRVVKDTVNECARQVAELAYKVSNLQAVRPSEASQMGIKILFECVKSIQAVTQQPVIDANARKTNDEVEPSAPVAYSR